MLGVAFSTRTECMDGPQIAKPLRLSRVLCYFIAGLEATFKIITRGIVDGIATPLKSGDQVLLFLARYVLAVRQPREFG